MKLFTTLSGIVVLSVFVNGYGQDNMPAFEFIQNLESIGITPIFLDRWGCISADIDNNGWPDLLLKKWRGGGVNDHSQIYLNNGGVFTEISEQSPQLAQKEREEAWTRSPSLADFDNDGDKDLFWGSDKNMFLFRNDDNVFVNVSDAMGLKAVKPPGLISVYTVDIGAWADYDRDGDLDLLVNQTNNRDYYFYRNDGEVFTNIAAQVGLTGIAPFGKFLDQGYWGARAQWVDFDFDGDADFSSGNKLFRNENGIFVDVSQETGFLVNEEVKFCDWFDYDNDGDLDFFKTVSGSGSAGTNELWAYEDGHFVDMSQVTGISISAPGHGPQDGLSLGDYDNDGDIDIFVQINAEAGGIEVLLLNEEVEGGGRAFADVAGYVGLDQTGDRMGSTVFDYNMDGFLDIFIASAEKGIFAYCNLGNNNNWVGFILQGTESNRDAIGTLVTVYAEGQKRIRYTRVPTSWNTQDHPYVHFGLGTATAIDSVVIRWPLGRVEVLTEVAINQYHKVIEGEATSVRMQNQVAQLKFELEQNCPNPFNPQTTIQYSVPRPCDGQLIIYNLIGNEVRSFHFSHTSAGTYQIAWDGSDAVGQFVPSGTYFYRLTVDEFSIVRKMTFLR